MATHTFPDTGAQSVSTHPTTTTDESFIAVVGKDSVGEAVGLEFTSMRHAYRVANALLRASGHHKEA